MPEELSVAINSTVANHPKGIPLDKFKQVFKVIMSRLSAFYLMPTCVETGRAWTRASLLATWVLLCGRDAGACSRCEGGEAIHLPRGDGAPSTGVCGQRN